MDRFRLLKGEDRISRFEDQERGTVRSFCARCGTPLAEIEAVLAHELAHMWFGDLVTMSWWNGIWLNEAFATFMEMLAVDAWKPEWQRWATFGVSRAAALSLDGLHSTRPIEFPVTSPRDADAMFDVLTYEKGASVLRMLEQHLSAELFRDGVGVGPYIERVDPLDADGFLGEARAGVAVALTRPTATPITTAGRPRRSGSASTTTSS